MKGGVTAALVLLALAGCGGSGGDYDVEGSPPQTTDDILVVPKSEKGREASTQGSGQGSGSTRTDYISRADRVCGRYLPRIEALEKKAQVAAAGGDYDAAADSFARGVAESQREVAALRSVPAPNGSQAVLSRMYAGFEEANRLFRGSIDDLRSGDVNAFNNLGDQARLASDRSKRIAIAFGFEVCGQPD